MCAAVTAALVVAARGVAYDGTQNLDVYRGPVVSDARVVGMSGAFAAVAEGQIGQPANQAALAHRRPNLHRSWDWDFIFMLPFTVRDLTTVDVDNDGTQGPFTNFFSVQLGLSGQVRRWGFGLHVQVDAYEERVPDPVRPVRTIKLFGVANSITTLGLARALFGDELIVGAALFLAATDVSGDVTRIVYSGGGLQLGALYRPAGRTWRAGASIRQGVELSANVPPAPLFADCGAAPKSPCVRPFARAVIPWEITVGGAWRFGAGSTAFNRPSIEARREVADTSAPGGPETSPQAPTPDGPSRTPTDEEPADAPPGPVLLAADLVVISGSPNAIGVDGFAVQFQAGAPEPRRSGTSVTVSPRLGLEWEPFPRRFRIRAGSYFEPSRFDDRLGRVHLTLGLEVRVLWEFRLSLAADAARDYANVSLGLGFWFP